MLNFHFVNIKSLIEIDLITAEFHHFVEEILLKFEFD